MGSFNSKPSYPRSDASNASNDVTRDLLDPILQHGSSTGDNGPSQGEWILVSPSNSKIPFKKAKVSAAQESASNASGRKGHITTTTMTTLKEALKTINNIFLLLVEEEVVLNQPQEDPNYSSYNECNDANSHSGLYACKTNNKTTKINQKHVLPQKNQKKERYNKNIKSRSLKSKERNHKGNKYSDKPYPKPLPKNLRKKSPSKHPNQCPKLQTKASTQSTAVLKAKIAICKQRKALWMKQNKGHRFSMWKQNKMDKKSLNLTNLDDIHCLYQHLNHLNFMLDQVHDKARICDKSYEFSEFRSKQVKIARKKSKNVSKSHKTMENTILRASTSSTPTTKTNNINSTSKLRVILGSTRRSTLRASRNSRANTSVCHFASDISSITSNNIIKDSPLITPFCGLRDSPLFSIISSKLSTTILQRAALIMTVQERFVETIQNECHERTKLGKEPRFPLLGPMSTPSNPPNTSSLVQHQTNRPVIAATTQQQQKGVLAFVVIPPDWSCSCCPLRGQKPSMLLTATPNKRLSFTKRTPMLNASINKVNRKPKGQHRSSITMLLLLRVL